MPGWLTWSLTAIKNGYAPLQFMLPPCVQQEARSQHKEDLMVLVPLLCMRNGGQGTFSELGAFTGVNFSNTVMLERCYNWTGALIEGSPANYAKLAVSGRRSKMVHSAVCPKDGTVSFDDGLEDAASASDANTRLEHIQQHRVKALKNKQEQKQQHHQQQPRAVTRKNSTLVPCRRLGHLLDEMAFPTIDILFLDIEGAEENALRSVDLTRFAVIVMEAAGYPNDGGRLTNRLEPLLLRAGFRRRRELEARERGRWNPAYVRSNGPMSRRCVTCLQNQTCRDQYVPSITAGLDYALQQRKQRGR